MKIETSVPLLRTSGVAGRLVSSWEEDARHTDKTHDEVTAYLIELEYPESSSITCECPLDSFSEEVVLE